MDIENRTYLNLNVVKLLQLTPTWIPLQDNDICDCKPKLVFGKENGNSWEKDISIACIKAYLGDSVVFKLYNGDGNETIYSPPNLNFIKDQYSWYTQIDWTSVLLSDGPGCYTLKIEYTIAGVSNIFIWEVFQLYEFSALIVEGTIRSKCIFNSNQSIFDIDFTNSNVIDTFRHVGFFGNMQQKTKIKNLVYPDFDTEKVVNQNFNEYTLEVYNLDDYSRIKLTDLHFLSADQIFISDFNTNNPVRTYLDFPVILSESSKTEHIETARNILLTATFEDKNKNKRSFF